MNIKITARQKDLSDYAALEGQGLHAEIKKIDGDGSLQNPWKIQVEIENQSDSDWNGVVHLEYIFDKRNPRFFLPGFMYGSNRGEAPLDVDTEFPRLREGQNHRPASPWWMVRSDRLSHPAAFVFDSGKMYGLCAAPYFIWEGKQKKVWKPGMQGDFFQYTGYTCSLEHCSIGYTLGYENAPWLFVQSHDVRERASMGQNCFLICSGEKILFDMNFYNYCAEDERTVYDAVQSVYELYHQSPRVIGSISSTVADISKAVSRDAWLEEEKAYSGFVFEDEDGSFSYNKLPSISWTNGLTVAVPILLSALRLQDEKMRQQALECINHVVAQSLNPLSGLPYEVCESGTWSNRGWWFDRMGTPGHSSYLVGQALYYICKASDYEMEFLGQEHHDWLEFVRNVIEKTETTKNSDNEYAFIMSEKTGAGLEYNAFAGAWCMAAAAYYSWLEKDFTFLDGLKESEAHYYEAYIKKSECYGAPLDTDKAVDSEGILAYIRAVRWMHRIMGEDIYLQHLRDALCYEFTFKFCYNSPIKVPPLSRIGWSSCGGSITSVANPHIHPMSSTVTDEMLYYIRQKPDAYIESRLQDTLLWNCQTYNTYDKEYDYGRKGWMSERFCHCEGLLAERYPDGTLASTWFALMPWACGCILEGLAGECWDCGMLNQTME